MAQLTVQPKLFFVFILILWVGNSSISFRAELLTTKAPTPAAAVVTGSLKARLEAEIDR